VCGDGFGWELWVFVGVWGVEYEGFYVQVAGVDGAGLVIWEKLCGVFCG
jgi:hypothetical protein